MVVLKEVDNMFWALFLEAGKRYSQKVEHSFHISMAALEIPTDNDQLKGKHHSVVSVMVGMDKGEFLLSSLNYKSCFQQPLDLNFGAGDEVTFFLNGEGNVHLTGYLMEDDPDFDSSMLGDDFESSEEMESDEDVPALIPSKGEKRKKESVVQPTKKLKWIEDEAEEADSDEDSDEDMDSDMDDMDDEILEFEDDDDEESEEEEIIVPKKKGKQTPKAEKTPKQDKQQKQEQQKSGQKGKKDQQVQKVNSSPQTPASKVGPEGDGTESQKKKKKKKKKKNQENESVSTPQQSKPEQKSQTPKQNQAKTPKKQVLAGGTVMEDVKSGHGVEAKSGKMVHVYYVGKLQKDGRQFDSCTGGKPFRFRLGSQEVIKGWDTGLAGMKVGGKRKLVIPPQQAYGNQKMGGIPPNSTLVFEVELKNVS